MTNKILVYHAGPLFTSAERSWNLNLAIEFRKLNGLSYNAIELILPQDISRGLRGKRSIFRACLTLLDSCQGVLCNLDGSDPDSGTSFEVGYAYTKNKVIAGYRTDIRNSSDCEDSAVNSMLDAACENIFTPKHQDMGVPILEISIFFLERLLH